MSTIVSLQLSVFCNRRIEPLPDIITGLLTELNELKEFVLLPSVVAGQNIDLQKRQITNISNIAFFSTNQLCQINCMDDRIDVKIDNSADLNRTLDFSKQVLSIILDKFGISGNRLALNLHIVGEIYTGALSESIYGKKLYTALDYYNDKDVLEWSIRTNARQEISIGGIVEKLNVITELSKTQNIINGNMSVLCHMDINTLAENTNYRFTSHDLSTFSTEVIPIVSEIRSNFERVGGNG